MESESKKQPVKELSRGFTMPMIGLGTDKIFDAEVIANAVTTVGYRMLDTASKYQNEESVGKAI